MLNFLCSEDPKQQNPLFFEYFPTENSGPTPQTSILCSKLSQIHQRCTIFLCSEDPTQQNPLLLNIFPWRTQTLGRPTPPNQYFVLQLSQIHQRCTIFRCSKDPNQQNPLLLNIFPWRTQTLGRPTPQTSILCANYRKYITDAQFSYAARTQSSKIHCC